LKLEEKLTEAHGDEKEEKLYRVQVGAFQKKENAEILLMRLFNEGFEGFVKYS